MILEELLQELKQYLRIEQDDTEQDDYLKSFCEAADGYISAQYNFNIITKPVTSKQMLTASRRNKLYLPKVPVIADSVEITKPDNTLETTPFTLIGGAIIFDEPIDYMFGVYTITYSSGTVDSVENRGDIEHCIQLAAWLYRIADKGLEGIDQISTGVKESAKMFAGIPKNITTYFESRQPIRL